MFCNTYLKCVLTKTVVIISLICLNELMTVLIGQSTVWNRINWVVLTYNKLTLNIVYTCISENQNVLTYILCHVWILFNLNIFYCSKKATNGSDTILWFCIDKFFYQLEYMFSNFYIISNRLPGVEKIFLVTSEYVVLRSWLI